MKAVESAWHKNLKIARERNKRAQANEKLVHKVVHRMTTICRESYEDLYQIGYMGLLKASERFDESKGHAFSSFAIPYIQGEIQHYLRSQWQSVKIPRSSLEIKAKVKRVKKSLALLGREVDELQIALNLGLSTQEWELLDSVSGSVTVSLDELLHEPASSDEEEINFDIKRHLNNLPSYQKNAILEKFFIGKTTQEIAKSQGRSSQEIQAWINRGIAKIRLELLKDYE